MFNYDSRHEFLSLAKVTIEAQLLSLKLEKTRMEALVKLLHDNGIEADINDPDTVIDKIIFNFNLQKQLKESWRSDCENLRNPKRAEQSQTNSLRRKVRAFGHNITN